MSGPAGRGRWRVSRRVPGPAGRGRPGWFPPIYPGRLHLVDGGGGGHGVAKAEPTQGQVIWDRRCRAGNDSAAIWVARPNACRGTVLVHRDRTFTCTECGCTDATDQHDWYVG